MDTVVSAISSALSGLGSWGPLVGAVVVIAYQYAKVQYPSTLASLPHLVPQAPAAPVPVPVTPAVPAPLAPAVAPSAPAFPILSAILGRVFGDAAPAPQAVAPAFLAALKSEVDALVKAPGK